MFVQGSRTKKGTEKAMKVSALAAPTKLKE